MKNISSNTKAVLVTNVYGVLCDFDELSNICKKNNFSNKDDRVVWCNFWEKKSGSLADISTFSF